MKPPAFDYFPAPTTREAVDALASNEDAKLIAGGQSLMPLLNLRIARPAVLIDLNPIKGLDFIDRSSPDEICVGGLTRHQALVTQDLHPLLSRAARWIGHTAIRTRGTIGGSLAHADPAAELPTLATALGATVSLEGIAGPREIAWDQLAVGPYQTALTHDEVLVSVRLPIPERWGFAEFANRHGDFAVALAVVAIVDGQFRIAVGGVGPTPIRLIDAESTLDDASDPRDCIPDALEALGVNLKPPDDVHASARHRTAIARHVLRQALEEALA